MKNQTKYLTELVVTNGQTPPPAPVASLPQTRNPSTSVLIVSQDTKSSNLMPRWTYNPPERVLVAVVVVAVK